MNNKIIILGLSLIGVTILCKKSFNYRKSYINKRRKKKKSWKYYE